MKDICIAGAGLCGTLLALRMAQRGHEVKLMEKRPDMRKADLIAGRSINLALSDRGLAALRMCGLEHKARQLCIPMRGRMIHTIDGQTRFSPYSGRDTDFINSISRSGLNELLLEEADNFDSVHIRFNAACENVDTKAGKATFRDTVSGEKIEINSDLIVGADGAGSAVRRSFMRHSANMRFDFSQSWLSHGYKELSIPANRNGEFKIDKNSLHIWPRDSFMLIALPNLDGSFTVTLFLAYEGKDSFSQLNDDASIQAFFEHYFPDTIELMPDLLEDFKTNPTSPLGTIKCYPWMAHGHTLLVGDAAHAIVPFYGQGMNAAFEDVSVLNSFLDSDMDWDESLAAFQAFRKPDADAIADLAIDNFFEMRDHVNNDDFIEKRKLEMQLEQENPAYFSKYSMVTFKEEMRYSEAMKQGRAQDKYLLEKTREKAHIDKEALLKELLSI